MPDDVDAEALGDMLTWVDEHQTIPEVAGFVQGLTTRLGMDLRALADERPAEALELCEALFWMIEDDFSDEQLHAYFKRNQPERRAETEIVLGDV